MRQGKTSMGLLAALVVTAVACGSTGSGNIVSETREVGSFDRIEISSGVAVEIIVDRAAPAGVTSIYDDNLQDKILTEVEGGTLVIEIQGNVIAPGSGRMVKVAMPTLEGLVADGGASIHGVGAVDELEFR
ncbi:MAG: DUF2807 domain-containing protein, partial [Acidimicrobiia bacterium]